jgi:hypothetical protein
VAQPQTVRLALRSWRREIMDVLQNVQHIVLAPALIRCGTEFWTRSDMKRTCCDHPALLEIERSNG